MKRDPYRRPFTVLDAQAATGVGNSINIAEFKNVAVSIVVSGQGAGDSLTVKCKTSDAESVPDFSAAQTAANDWEYSEMTRKKDTGGDETIIGSDGDSFANENETRHYEINTDTNSWLTFDVTAYTDGDASGAVTVKVRLYKD